MNILFEHKGFIAMHTFVYARVSTSDQTNDNQLLEIEQAGYEADTVYTDTISGKVPADERPEFGKMLDTVTRTRKPKRLIVTKLYQRREFLTRGGFPFCSGCDSRVVKEIRHVSMHCSSG